MMTSVSTRAPGKLNPTRQQLDELDALLQRMLELPVDPLDEAEPTENEEAVDEPLYAPETPPSLPPMTFGHEPPPSPPALASNHEPPPLLHPPQPRSSAPPVSYMVVETASPRPIPPASGFEPRPSMLTPRLVPVTTPPEAVEDEGEMFAPPSSPLPDLRMPHLSPPEGETPLPPTDPQAWVPLRSTWQPSAQTWQPLAESWHQANSGTLPNPELMFTKPITQPLPPEEQEEAPSYSSSPTVEKPQAVEEKAATEPQLRLTVADAPPPLSRPLLPLVWFNQGFDACVTPLGAVGRWLCGPQGRQMLGLAGLASLFAAVILAVSAGMGWSW